MKVKKENQLEKSCRSDEIKIMSGITGIYVMLMCSIYLLYTGSGGYEHITQAPLTGQTVRSICSFTPGRRSRQKSYAITGV